MSDTDADKFWTTAELAERWRVSEDTARRRVDEFKLSLPMRPRRIPHARLVAFEGRDGTKEVAAEPARKKIGRRPARRRKGDVLAGLL